MQQSARVNRDFPRYTATSRRGLAFLLLAFALLPQLFSLGTWDTFESIPTGAALHAGETAADAGSGSCELGATSCAAAATAAAASAAVLVSLLILLTGAAPVRRVLTAASSPRAFAAAPLLAPPRPPR